MNKETLKPFLEEHGLFLCVLALAIILRLLYASSSIRYISTDLSLQAYNLLHRQYDLNLLWYHLGVRYVMLLLVAGVYPGYMAEIVFNNPH